MIICLSFVDNNEGAYIDLTRKEMSCAKKVIKKYFVEWSSSNQCHNEQ